MKRQTSEKRNWKTETLRFEALENRELLSVNPSDALDFNSYANYASLESGMAPVVDIEITDDSVNDSPSLVLARASETASTVVTSLADKVDANDGVITLREAVTVYANAGDTITFDPALKGGTITLGGSQIEIKKSLTIDASALWNESDGVPGIVIDANSKSRIFNISATGKTIEIDSLAFTRGSVSGRMGDGYGGAVYANDSSTLIISNSNFHNNVANSTYGSAAFGGAVYAGHGSTLTISNSNFYNNTANRFGGAVYVETRSTLTISNSSFQNNTAGNHGGAVYFSGGYSSLLTVSNSSFTQNSASAGSAIYFAESPQSQSEAFNITVSGNASSGGALYCPDSLFYPPSSLHVYNSIIAGNPGGDFYRGGKGAIKFNAYNVLSSYTGWSNSNATAYVYDASKPLFANAAEGDYSLAPGSQAINRGNNEYVSTDVDLAGKPRIIDGTVDLGAFEYVTKLESPTITKTTSTDNKIVVKWNAIENASGYVVEYKKSEDSDYTVMSTTTATSRTISNLDSDTTYDVRVYAKGNGTYCMDSDYSAVASVTTQPFVETPSTTVTTWEDVVDAGDGLISLREAITLYSADGATIDFAPALKGATITLGGSEIAINKSLRIDASALWNETENAPGITIDANSQSRIFYITEGSVEIDSLSFTGGAASAGGYGGAICALSSSSLTISNSYFRNNTAFEGGAIYAGSSSTLTISSSNFQNNNVSGYGGAIYAERSSTLTIASSSFLNNAASNYGGGAINVYYSTLTIFNSRFINNEASYGSAISLYSGDVRLFNATIAGNVSSGPSSGAIYLYHDKNGSSQLDVYNSIVAGNENGDVAVQNSASGIVNAYNVLSGYADWSNADAVAFVYDPSQPLFADEENGDYSLAPGSQAINRGNNEYVSTDVDLAGNARILGGTVDLGAYEYDLIALNAPTITKTTSTDNKIVVKWNAIENASGYVVEYKKSEDSDYTVMSTTTATSRTISNLDSDTPYDVRVYAKGKERLSIDSDYSAVVTVTTQPLVETPSTTVTTPDDVVDAYDGKISLREAITLYSADGDTIDFAPTLKGATITLGGSEIAINKSLRIDASALWNETENAPGITIDANSQSRIFYITEGSVEIDSLAFTGGYAENNDTGGAIYAGSSTTVTISNAYFYQNRANSEGGAIFTSESTATISNTSFDNNSSANYGGAIDCYLSTLTISNSSFTNNVAEGNQGGAIDSSHSTTTISNSKFYNNRSQYHGGAIWSYYSTLTVSNSDFDNNHIEKAGGAINGSHSTLTISNSKFTRNTANSGSAIYIMSGVQTQLFNVTVSGNILSGDASAGAAFCNTGNNAYIYNSIIAGNNGMDVYRASGLINAYNVLSGNANWSNADAVAFVYDPSQPLFANAAEGDYSLAPGSQAINRGNNEYVSTDVDLAGNARILSGIVDLGAYEYDAPIPLDAPTFKSSSSTSDSVTIAWNAVANASGYVVEYKSASDSGYTVMPQTTATTMTIPNLASETTYKFRLYAVGDGTIYVDSGYSAVKAVKTKARPVETPSTTVTTPEDVVDAYDGKISLREAITLYSADGDTIDFAPTLKGATITLGGSQIKIEKSLKIDASALWNETEDAPGITIDANSQSRIFYIARGTAEIDSLAFTGGAASDFGGAIYLYYSSSATIFNSRFNNNTAPDGGAIYVPGSSLTLDNCNFSGNNASRQSGAIFANYSSTVTISSSRFDGNAAGYGGAAVGAANATTVTISNSNFQNNVASHGGAVYANNSVIVTIANSSFQNNVASNNGGVVEATYGSTITISDSILAHNTANSGSAVYTTSGVQTLLFNVTVSDNTLSGNNGVGAAIYHNGYSACFYNSIIAGNSGMDVYRAGGLISACHVLSDFSDWSNADAVAFAYDHSKPLFTNAEEGDYSLAVGSQAINRGNNEYVSNDVDLVGNARIIGGVVDLGACEYEPPITADPVPLDVPTFKSSSSTSDSVTVTWNAIANATSYVVEYKNASDTRYTVMPATTATTISIASLEAETTYKLRVYAVGDGTNYSDSAFSAVKAVKTKPGNKETPSTTVTTSDDVVDAYDGKISLREAITLYSANGDTIDFAPALKGARITLGGSEIAIEKSIRIDASALWNETENAPGVTIDADSKSRIFYITEGRVEIDSLTITGGSVSDYGGAIYAYNGSTTKIFNSNFHNNAASSGGAIYAIHSSTVAISNSNFHNNAATAPTDSYGGAIFAYYSSTITISNSSFQNNTASTYGGAIRAIFGSTVTISNSSFQNNSARIEGGAIFATSTLTVSGSTFHNNSSLGSNIGYGGAIFASSTATISNSSFTRNEARLGSAIYLSSSTNGRLFNVTVADNNNVNSSSGAIYLESNSHLDIYNSIVAENAEGDFYLTDASGSVNAYNVLSGYADWSNADAIAFVYNTSQPLFADAENGDYSLAPGSQAINRGDNEYVSTDVDLAGNARILDGTVDLGAYEYSAPITVDPTPLDVPTFKSSSSTSDSVTIAWNAVANASGYVVEYKSASDSGYTVMPQTTATTITIPNLASETTYKFRLYAVGDGTTYADSGYSAVKAVKTKAASVDPTPLDVPTFKSSSSTSDSVTITWNAVANATGYVVEYKSASDSGYTVMPQTTATTITIPNLASETTYKFRLYAVGDGTIYVDSGYSAVKAVKTKERQQETPATTVTTSDDVVDAYDGKISLREAITLYSADGDTIDFALTLKGATITLGGSQIKINKSLRIDASALWDETNSVPGITVDANSQSRIFNIPQGNVEIDSLAFTGGYDLNNGGAIYATGGESSSVIVSNSYFHNNSAGYGGAIVVSNPTSLTIANSRFQNNAVTYGGGAICFFNYSTVTISSSSFQNNTANNGGALYADRSSTATISNSSFQNNSVNLNGGALYVDRSSTATISNSSLHDNASSAYGGALYAGSSSTAIISNSSLCDNAASYGGGAIFASSSTLTLANSSFTQNESRYGSAFYVSSGNGRLFNATIAGNNATESSGGALHLQGTSQLDFYNSIVDGNENGDVDVQNGANCAVNAHNVLSGYADWSNADAIAFAYDPSQPLFANAAEGDYSLADGSQALNRGNNEYVSTDVDLAGNARIIGGTVDLGAYERQNEASSLTASSYNASTRQAVLIWDANPDATTYKLQISKDGGATWTNYKTGLSTRTATVNGLYVGKTYGFRVYGISSSGATLPNYFETTFSPSNSSNSVIDDFFADFFDEEFLEF